MPQERASVKNLLASQDFLAIPSTWYCLDLIVFRLFSTGRTRGNVRLKTAWFLLWNDNTLPRQFIHAERANSDFPVWLLPAGEAIGDKRKSREMPGQAGA